MVELDFGLDSQTAQIGPQLAVAVAFGNADRLEHLDVAPRRRQRDDAGLIDGRHEWRSAAVHDRNFRTIDVDDGVIDAESVQCRQNVFGRRYSGPVFIAEDGREFGRGHGAEMGPQFPIGLVTGAAADEHDAGIGLGRMQRDAGG